jgi:hypothetical protein
MKIIRNVFFRHYRYCGQFTALSATYCATTGTVAVVDGKPFFQQCPVMCGTCSLRSTSLSRSSVTPAKLEKREN